MNLTLAQHVELCVGPDAVFDGTAFATEDERREARFRHRDALLARDDREPWALTFYEGGRRAA